MSSSQTAVQASLAPADTVDGQYTVLPGQLPDGQYILSVLLKRTFDIVSDGQCTRAEDDTPLLAGDVYWGDPMNSSVKFEADFSPYKLATDVMLNGTVYAPGGQSTQSCEASLQVEEIIKKILITGNRTAHFVQGSSPVISDPERFKTMDLRYENAYGGVDVRSDTSRQYPHPLNLLGKGFVVNNTKESVEGLQLPNIEDPDHLLTADNLCVDEYEQWEQGPRPTGLGAYPKTWWGRAQYAGVLPADRKYEQMMRKEYAKLVPKEQRAAYLDNGLKDIDFRFFSAASDGLALPYLQGGERVIARNLTADGQSQFIVPDQKPVIGLDIGEGIQQPQVDMHTLMIRMDEQQLDIVWRAALPYEGPESLPELQRMSISVQ